MRLRSKCCTTVLRSDDNSRHKETRGFNKLDIFGQLRLTFFSKINGLLTIFIFLSYCYQNG